MANKPAKTRMCILCRQNGAKNDFYRIVKTKDGKTAIDGENNIFGRGAYICKKETCILKAQKIRAVERALRCEDVQTIYTELLKTVE